MPSPEDVRRYVEKPSPLVDRTKPRPRLDADARARARRMHEAGQTIAHIAETLGCSRPSVQRVLGILR